MAKLGVVSVFHDQLRPFYCRCAKIVVGSPYIPTTANFAASVRHVSKRTRACLPRTNSAHAADTTTFTAFAGRTARAAVLRAALAASAARAVLAVSTGHRIRLPSLHSLHSLRRYIRELATLLAQF